MSEEKLTKQLASYGKLADRLASRLEALQREKEADAALQQARKELEAQKVTLEQLEAKYTAREKLLQEEDAQIREMVRQAWLDEKGQLRTKQKTLDFGRIRFQMKDRVSIEVPDEFALLDKLRELKLTKGVVKNVAFDKKGLSEVVSAYGDAVQGLVAIEKNPTLSVTVKEESA